MSKTHSEREVLPSHDDSCADSSNPPCLAAATSFRRLGGNAFFLFNFQPVAPPCAWWHDISMFVFFQTHTHCRCEPLLYSVRFNCSADEKWAPFLPFGLGHSILLINYYLSQICRSILLDSHLTTYIPQAVNNIPYFLHYFTSRRLRIFLSPQFEKKKSNKDSRKQRTWTEDHSLKNLRSIHLGYLRADNCRWKKVDQTISNRTATDYLY